jgi:exonuclease VII small subunit|tara:strand:- start:1022 stop:1201 length:180 start_codon:yes stop_codon:yes gene_type:complete
VQFIGEELNMNKEKEQDIEIDIKQLYKVVDKLEQRIAKLEKVLASHAKCIGELREDNNE